MGEKNQHYPRGLKEEKGIGTVTRQLLSADILLYFKVNKVFLCYFFPTIYSLGGHHILMLAIIKFHIKPSHVLFPEE